MRYLESPVGSVRLMIRDGKLFVQSDSSTIGYVDGTPPPEREGNWTAAGDFVEFRDNRVHFMGRKGEIINVGGVKVYPPAVEDSDPQSRGVRDVRMCGKANRVTGQLVAANIEVSGTEPNEAGWPGVRKGCRAAPNKYEQPRALRIVEQLNRSNEKLVKNEKHSNHLLVGQGSGPGYRGRVPCRSSNTTSSHVAETDAVYQSARRHRHDQSLLPRNDQAPVGGESST